MLTVMKFGGTSVGSAEALERAADIIVSAKTNRVVVVSAMSGITNFLIAALEDGAEHADRVFAEFEERHLSVAKQLLDGDRYDAFLEEFRERMDRFREVFSDPANWSDPYFRDCISSQGERFSSLLLAHLIRTKGHKSQALTSEQAGIVAFGQPLNGTCDLERTASGMGMKVKPLVTSGVIPVITGFYGINEEGKPLTFGRGGSDYAATAIGNALDADMIEIWTDVNGFMSADPRIVPDAVTIEEMNFSEAAELAYFGAKVLHPRTIEPARMKHIGVKIKNSYHPENFGTHIHNLRRKSDSRLKSVAMKSDLSIVTIKSGELAYRIKLIARIVDRIGDADIPVYAISTSLSTIAFLVHNNDVTRILGSMEAIRHEIEGIDVKSDVSLICTVGDDLLDRLGISGDVFGAVKDAGANVEMISEGASDVSLNFVVPTESALEVVRCIHSRFITGGCE